MSEFAVTKIDAWDPLAATSDPDMVIVAQRREIRNILRSYTGYYDLFAELIQNALDAVERRAAENEKGYEPALWIRIDIAKSEVSVTDNGCGMNESEYRQFLRPNFSFKDREISRGNKGVGATYLAYGFNSLQVSTRSDGSTFSGVIKRGREWVEDRTESIPRPKVEATDLCHSSFQTVDRGTSMTVKLIGSAIRPRDLSWVGAETADQWLAVLRTVTSLGGIYLCDAEQSNITTNIEVVSAVEKVTIAILEKPRYLYPSDAMNRVADLRDYLANRKRRMEKGLDMTKIPPKYRSLHGVWGEWTGEEILDAKSECPIVVRMNEHEVELLRELGIKLRIFLAFSTDLWDTYNDKKLKLRKGHRLLRGGLQLATRNMPQGMPLTIPMTNNIGFQNMAHVIIHFEDAEPDLGRKGFQPDIIRVAEKISVSAVTAFRRHYGLLRKPGGAKEYNDELKLEQWKKEQEVHEEKFPLVITGSGLFMPTEELPIRSEPVVEQDVVALFNQMLSSGLVRGIQLISSSQYKQYDGLYRIKMVKPFDRFVLGDENPLGIDEEHFIEKDELETVVKVLEYKYTVDGLIEEIQGEVKAVEDVDLLVAWELGEKWRQLFDVTTYLDQDNVHLRNVHGATHSFTHSMTGSHAFEAIILEDLVKYLKDPLAEEKRQREQLGLDAAE